MFQLLPCNAYRPCALGDGALPYFPPTGGLHFKFLSRHSFSDGGSMFDVRRSTFDVHAKGT